MVDGPDMATPAAGGLGKGDPAVAGELAEAEADSFPAKSGDLGQPSDVGLDVLICTVSGTILASYLAGFGDLFGRCRVSTPHPDRRHVTKRPNSVQETCQINRQFTRLGQAAVG